MSEKDEFMPKNHEPDKVENIIADAVNNAIDETTSLVDNVAETIASEEKRISEVIDQLNVDIEQVSQQTITLVAQIKNFIRCICSCGRTKIKTTEEGVEFTGGAVEPTEGDVEPAEGDVEPFEENVEPTEGDIINPENKA